MSSIFGVSVIKLNRAQLIQSIKDRVSENSRLSLYFLYSEFVIRANRLPAYREVLNRAWLSSVDGRGLMWAIWSVKKTSNLGLLYAWICNLIQKTGLNFQVAAILRIILFLPLFGLNLIWNIIVGFVTITGKYSFDKDLEMEIVLGRDFVWDLLQLANDRSWKVSVVGGSKNSDLITINLIKTFFPNIELTTWTKPKDSNLINDIPKNLKESKSSQLTSQNICEFYPDLYDAKDFLKEKKPDLILLCLGGGSGKQEFFADNIKRDLSIKFGLVAGLGAAIDYMSGEKNTPPAWVCKMGLEWVFRLVHQPYRRFRIIDDILTLWWWTSLQQFTDYLDFRPTVICLVQNTNGHFLAVKRREFLPGDIGWAFVQGGIEAGERPETAAVRELKEEAGLKIEDLEILRVDQDLNEELYSTSLIRFLALGALYQGSQSQIVHLKYNGSETPKVNFENSEAIWINQNEIMDVISPEKRVYWRE